MIKHYSKDAIPLPKIEYKKESGGNGYNPDKESLDYLAKMFKREMFKAMCERAAKAAFDEGLTEVYLLNSAQIKQALLEYCEREQHFEIERHLIEPMRVRFRINKGFCTPDRINYTAVRCMTNDLTKHVKIRSIEDKGDYSVFEAELNVVDRR